MCRFEENNPCCIYFASRQTPGKINKTKWRSNNVLFPDYIVANFLGHPAYLICCSKIVYQFDIPLQKIVPHTLSHTVEHRELDSFPPPPPPPPPNNIV